MQYQNQHEAFKELAIRRGISRLAQLEEAFPLGYQVPARIVERWLNKLLTVPSEFSTQRRYVNRFKIGADPEFIFSSNVGRQDASVFGLAQGLAYGMDNNGRLAEIRPHPSRSALEVVASTLATLRWLAVLRPDTQAFNWLAGAFLQGDGLGGHVHFGRKRPNRDLEIKALDILDEQFLQAGLFPVQEVKRRREGDAHRQRYGLPGDYRKQRHGYEYRVFPSWLDSPELAFLTLTFAKLVVHNPNLVQGYFPSNDATIKHYRLLNLLSYYKDVDDDARLALLMFAKGFPPYRGGNFKGRWGLEGIPTISRPPISFIPSSIKPSLVDVQELFVRFVNQMRLTWVEPTPTWAPLNPPDKYRMTISLINTQGVKGLGELLWDVCQHENCNFRIASTREWERRDGALLLIPKVLEKMLPERWKALCGGGVCTQKWDNRTIFSIEQRREAGEIAETRRLLLETVFPFWQIDKVKADSFNQWKKSCREPSLKAKSWRGTMVWGEEGLLPLR